MKTSEEYFELAKENVPDVCTLTIIHKEMIRLAQKDAYNQAIDDAAKNVETEIDWDGQRIFESINYDSILKLKKQ